MSYQVAIVGYGGMGHYHRKSISEVDCFSVRGLYDINPDKTKKAGGSVPVYASFDEVLSDPAIDIVLIATPNNFHRELAVKGLEAGKHVICEKPAALDSRELSEMITASIRAGRLFSVHQNRRWDKDFRIVKRAVEEGLIGKPYCIESRVQGSSGVPGDWRCVAEAGGGMLLDWGVHLLDQMLWLVKSPVVNVFAHLLKVRYDEVDDNLKVLLRFENGFSALIQVDTCCFDPLPRWYAAGDAGTLQIKNWACEGQVTRVKASTMEWEPGIVYTAAGPTRTMAPRPVETIERLPLPAADPDARDFYRNFAAALDGREPLVVDPQECLRVMKVIDAAFLSEKTGTSVNCRL